MAASGAAAAFRPEPGAVAKRWPRETTVLAAQPATNSAGTATPWPTVSSRSATASAGIITTLATKSAVRLAKTPKLAMRLKCWMAKGPVAAPATRLTMKRATSQSRARWGQARYQGRPVGAGRLGQTSARATSEAVAQNDISNPG